jgi:D-alanyl-D-alanine carboxypeptidase/D-alanyl-D-alanine-endopeptidase (penicillin-binding protein 4)
MSFFFGLFTFVVLVTSAGAQTRAASFADSLQALVDSVAPDARLGLSVYSLQKEEFLYQIRAEEAFRPASTLKLIVTAAALDTMPLDEGPETTLLLDGDLRGRHFTGRLTVIGRGDPNISARYYESPYSVFYLWADSLKKMGVDTLSGPWVMDTSFYYGPRRVAEWEDRFHDRCYGTVVSPLSFNDNCVQMIVSRDTTQDSLVQTEFKPEGLNVYRVDSVGVEIIDRPAYRRWTYFSIQPDSNVITVEGQMGRKAGARYHALPVRRPHEVFRQAMYKAFQERGLVVDTSVAVVQTLPAWRLFRFSAAPWLSLLDEVNQRSQNLQAETLLFHVGNWYFGQASRANGLAGNRRFLTKIGLDSNEFILQDGCGLSYGNRVQPRNMSLLLRYMARHPRRDYYMSSLGLPGVSGAYATRLAHLPESHRMRMKTGFVNNTQGLSGYMYTAEQDTLAVALYLNEYQIKDREARKLMDTLWSRLLELHNQEMNSLREARQLWYEADSIADFSERIGYFSGALLNKPYIAGPTGEGWQGLVDDGPLFNMNGFDCVTYIEHVLALSRAESPDDLLQELTAIRYRDGRVAYRERKHFFVEDWLRHSDFAEVLRFSGDSTGVRISDKKWFYGLKEMEWEGENPETPLHFIPYVQALEMAQNWERTEVTGIGFIGTFGKLWVTHTGLVFAREGRAVLRHASTKGDRVREDDLYEYLLSRGGEKVPGVVFFSLQKEEKEKRAQQEESISPEKFSEQDNPE